MGEAGITLPGPGRARLYERIGREDACRSPQQRLQNLADVPYGVRRQHQVGVPRLPWRCCVPATRERPPLPFLTVMVGAEAAGPALRHEKGRLYGKVGQCTTMEMLRRVEKFLCCTQWSRVSYMGSSAEYGGR